MISKFTGEYSFLSNFYIVPISYEGIIYPSVEHAFQAAKTLDGKKKLEIARFDTPGKAKKAGRKLKLRADWEEIKLDIMLELLRKKFFFKDLQEMLLKTGDEELIEGNSWGDTYWGKYYGVGENHLGKLLLQVREEIRNGNQTNQSGV